MMVALLGAGIGFFLVGLLSIGFGFQLDLSFGNTLILAGAVALCTGAILCGMWIAVRELKPGGRQLGVEPRLQPAVADAAQAVSGPDSSSFQFNPGSEAGGGEQAAAGSSVPPPPPWLEESGTRTRSDGQPPPEAAEASPPVKPRRNLLFSSSSRKERERAQARAVDPSVLDSVPEPVVPPAPPEAAEPPPASFDDAWPKSERARGSDVPPPRRAGNRTPSTFNEANAPAAVRAAPLARTEETPPVTVLKSGVVDGMAYSLYSDGSIEAQMPEGMMRFASIDELRAHLEQRP